jgi:hypothetical protein
VNRLNPTAVFLIALVVVLTAFVVPGPVGGMLLLLVAALAGALLLGSWTTLPAGGRTLRVGVLALLVAIGLYRILAGVA